MTERRRGARDGGNDADPKRARRKAADELYTQPEQVFLRRLGRRIAGLRVERDLSQAAFAEQAGLNRSYLGFIETGSRNPHVLVLRKVAAALKVSVRDLFLFEE